MKTVKVVAALIRSENRILATQRGYGDQKDYWEFPGGKVEPGESPRQALEREIREELDARIRVEDFLTTLEYDYPTFHLSMDCYFASLPEGTVTLKEHEAARWLSPQELEGMNWLPADRALLEPLRRALGEAGNAPHSQAGGCP